jgi:hypothetical protein
LESGMVVCAYNPGTGEVGAANLELQASKGYIDSSRVA